jgi:hypothetical protein
MINKVIFNLLITIQAQSKKLAISQCLFHLVPMCPSTGLTWLITGEEVGAKSTMGIMNLNIRRS